MKITLPKSFGIENVPQFLNDVSVIFGFENKKVPDFTLDVSKVRSISLIGQLLFYKFISYTAENECFNDPQILGNDDPWLDNKLKEYGFFDIVMAYINTPKSKDKILSSYRKLEIKEIKRDTTKVLIAPQKLLRQEEKIRNALEQKWFSELFDFYGRNTASNIASICIGELLSNFWSHATSESGTVMVAMGNLNYIEICIADNAMGIISSLKESNVTYRNMKDIDVLSLAFTKGVTSKPNTSHMGLGLYLIKEIALANNGHFTTYSGGYYYEQKHGKCITGKIGYWKGTVIYLRLDFSRVTGIEEISALQPTKALPIMWR